MKRINLHNRQPRQGTAATIAWRRRYACAATVVLFSAESPEFQGDIDLVGGSTLLEAPPSD